MRAPNHVSTSVGGPGATITRDLIFVLGLALALRLLRILFLVPVVEIEGSEYGRIAENLMAGEGYVGLIAGPELMLPPLYPVAIASLAPLCGNDVILSGRIVSLIAGLVTVAGLYLIALRCHGRVVALWTGGCAALLPALVLTGSSVFSEGLLVCFLTLGILFFLRAAEGRLMPALISGLCFGLAYLARVESIGIAPIAALLLLFRWPRQGAPAGSGLAPAALLMSGFLLAGLPYPLFLQQATGRLEFAGKSDRVFATIERFGLGMTLPQANYAVAKDGTPEGTWLDPNTPHQGPGPVEIIRRSPGPIASYLGKNFVRTTWMLVSGKGVLSIFFLLAFVLAFRDPNRSRQVQVLDAFLIAMFLYVCVVASIYKVLLRYVMPLAIPTAIWGTRGLFEAIRRRALWRKLLSPKVVRAGGMCLLLLSTSRGVFTGFSEFDEAKQHPHGAVLELGQWLRNNDDQATVMADDSRVPFYGGCTWVPLPVTPDWKTLNGYGLRMGARYLSLEVPPVGVACVRPGEWFNATRPPEGVVLVFQSKNRTRALFRLDR